MNFQQQLVSLNACNAAVHWVGDRTLAQAWKDCERSDWMLWLLASVRVNEPPMVGWFALEVWHMVPEEAQLACAWAIDCALRGADDKECQAAYAAAYADAANAAAAANAANAAYAAADAAASMRRKQCNIIRELVPLVRVREALAAELARRGA